jgi:hypothetical protein
MFHVSRFERTAFSIIATRCSLVALSGNRGGSNATPPSFSVGPEVLSAIFSDYLRTNEIHSASKVRGVVCFYQPLHPCPDALTSGTAVSHGTWLCSFSPRRPANPLPLLSWTGLDSWALQGWSSCSSCSFMRLRRITYVLNDDCIHFLSQSSEPRCGCHDAVALSLSLSHSLTLSLTHTETHVRTCIFMKHE